MNGSTPTTPTDCLAGRYSPAGEGYCKMCPIGIYILVMELHDCYFYYLLSFIQDQVWSQDFSGGVTFVKGRGVTIHHLFTKICKLGACFFYFSYVLAQNGG